MNKTQSIPEMTTDFCWALCNICGCVWSGHWGSAKVRCPDCKNTTTSDFPKKTKEMVKMMEDQRGHFIKLVLNRRNQISEERKRI